MSSARSTRPASDESVLLGLDAQDPSMVVVGPRFTSEPYGLGNAQPHPEFVRFANRGREGANGAGRDLQAELAELALEAEIAPATVRLG